MMYPQRVSTSAVTKGEVGAASTLDEGNSGSPSKNLTIQASEGFLSFQPVSRKEASPVPRSARRIQRLVAAAADRRGSRGEDACGWMPGVRGAARRGELSAQAAWR
jgi:hypothetical protein